MNNFKLDKELMRLEEEAYRCAQDIINDMVLFMEILRKGEGHTLPYGPIGLKNHAHDLSQFCAIMHYHTFIRDQLIPIIKGDHSDPVYVLSACKCDLAPTCPVHDKKL